MNLADMYVKGILNYPDGILLRQTKRKPMKLRVNLQRDIESAIESTLLIAMCAFSHATPYRWWVDTLICIAIVMALVTNRYVAEKHADRRLQREKLEQMAEHFKKYNEIRKE